MYRNFLNVAVAAPGGVHNYFNSRPGVGATVTGTSRNDQITDGAAGNTLAGGAGDDQYQVAFDTTRIIEAPGGGIDAVTAYNNIALGANVEIGRVHGDLITMVAAPTGSQLQAYGSRDVLAGGRGNDLLIDETSNKQTLFEINDGSGKDVIYKFTATGANHDLIRLNDPQFTSFAAVRSAMSQVGSDVLLNLSSTDKLLIKDVRIGDLTPDDFLLRFSPTGLKMTFNDEFNGLSLYNDATRAGTWDTTFRYGPDNSLIARTLPGNGELQVYTDPKLGPNPFRVGNGELSITAEKLTAAESAQLWNYKYSSGLLTTEHSFAQTYGYFEIKAELPVEQGMFPAFWLMPKAAVWPPEIDVMENVGQNWVSGGAIAPNHSDAFRTFFPDGLRGDHTYGLLWNKQSITWYVDGKAVGSVPTPPSMHQPMYLLVNLAVGGDWAGAPPANFDSATMNIDYVRAYSLNNAPASTPSAPTSPPPAPKPQPQPAPQPLEETVLSAVTTSLGSTQTHLVLTGNRAIDGIGNALDNILSGNVAANKLTGGNGDDHLYGKIGNDALLGGNGDDILKGGIGADAMTGGGGDDRYQVDSSADHIVELPGGGDDRVIASVSTTLAANVEDLSLIGKAAINGTGNQGANAVIGNDGANVLTGHGGNDKLVGDRGDDVLIGGQGDDLLVGGQGNDRFVFAPGFGDDRIADFGAGNAKDLIDLSALIKAGIRPILSDSGAGMVISAPGGHSITLLGVDPHELTATSTGYVYDGY